MTSTFPAGTFPALETARLVLRDWRDADLEPFCALNADPAVMAFFPDTLTKEQTLNYVEKAKMLFARRGFGKWAVEVKETRDFIGCVGVGIVDFDVPVKGLPELGWRVASRYWGQGYAPEAAKAVADFMFGTGCPEVVAFTVLNNTPSRRVMEKIGMTHDPAGDFDHPKLPEGHRLRRHALYRLRKAS